MQLDTEVTEAGRRGTEKCIGANATAVITRYVNPDFPGPDIQILLCELRFALSDLCGKIGPEDLG